MTNTSTLSKTATALGKSAGTLFTYATRTEASDIKLIQDELIDPSPEHRFLKSASVRLLHHQHDKRNEHKKHVLPAAYKSLVKVGFAEFPQAEPEDNDFVAGSYEIVGFTRPDHSEIILMDEPAMGEGIYVANQAAYDAFATRIVLEKNGDVTKYGETFLHNDKHRAVLALAASLKTIDDYLIDAMVGSGYEKPILFVDEKFLSLDKLHWIWAA